MSICTAPTLSNEQPPVTVYSSLNCDGAGGTISPGSSAINPASFGVSNIRSMTIPGNLTVNVTSSSGNTSLTGGSYGDLSQHLTLPIASVTVENPSTPWNQYLLNCCQGVGTQSQCGDYWNNGAGCAQLASSAGCADSVLSANCRAVCLATPGACDDAAKTYCAANPTDPFCSCLVADTTSDPNPWCTVQQCQVSGYKPQSAIGSMGANCPSVTICNQAQNTSDSALSLFDFQYLQCGGTGSSKGLLQLLLLVVIVAGVGYVIYTSLGSSQSPPRMGELGGPGYGYPPSSYPPTYGSPYPPTYLPRFG